MTIIDWFIVIGLSSTINSKQELILQNSDRSKYIQVEGGLEYGDSGYFRVEDVECFEATRTESIDGKTNSEPVQMCAAKKIFKMETDK